MKTLITGYKGDVGSILFNLYKEAKEDIVPLDTTVDINSERIIHLAAKSPPATSDEIIKSNILYLQDIVRYAIRNNIKEIIFFSAVALYGNPTKENLSETDKIERPNLYGVSKLLGEEILKESPINALCLRFPAILCLKNSTNFISRCYLKLKNNNRLELTNPNELFNNFISVESIFRFLTQVKLVEKFDVINLASKKEKTLLEIVTLMKESLNSQSEIEISDKKSNFFNISTQKAEIKYGFVPYSVKDSLEDWIQQRKLYEGY